jgi:hypothetical protein
MVKSKLSLEIRNELLGLFRYWNNDRPNLRHTMEVYWMSQCWVCTTNSYALILIKNQNDIPVDKEAKTPNIEAILPNHVIEYNLDIDRTLGLYELIPIITRFKQEECETCDGNGEFDRDGYSYDCKSCGEKGYLELGTKESIADPKYFIEIDGKHLSTDRWAELTRVIKGIKPKHVTLLRNDEKPGLVLFRLDDEIVIALARTANQGSEKVVSYVIEENEATK